MHAHNGTMDRRRFIQRAVVTGAALSGAAWLAPARFGRAQARRELVIAQNQDNQLLDPHLMQVSVDRAIWFSVYNGLLRFDSTMMQPTPDLAERWEMIDPVTYRFYLRPGVRFHSGRPFDADDVIYNFNRVWEIGPRGRIAGYLFDVDRIEKVDSMTVDIILKAPSAVFINYLPFAVMVDRETIDQIDTHPIGTGPYVFERRVVNDHILLSKNTDFWDDITPRRPDTLRLIPVTEEQTRIAMLQSGQVDLAGWLSPILSRTLQNAPNITLHVPEVSASYYVIMMNTQTEPFNDVRVRQAVALAVDQSVFQRNANFGVGEASCNPLPSTHWAYDPSVACPDRDPQRAKQLLAEAGYPNGLHITGKFFANDYMRRASQILQQQLAEAGITMDIVMQDFAVWVEEVYVRREFTLGMTQLTREPDPDGLMQSVFRQGGGNNPMQYYNPDVERWFDLGKQTSDPAERKEYYNNIVRTVIEEAPIVKLHTNDIIWAAGPRVGGVAIHPNGTPSMPDLVVL